jgi:hypothetical protein
MADQEIGEGLPLLDGSLGFKEKPSSKRIALMAGALLIGAGTLGFIQNQNSNELINEQLSTSDPFEGLSNEPTFGVNDWILKKVTHLCHKSDITETFSFLQKYLMVKVEDLSNLGCGASRIKVSTSLPYDNTLHSGAIQFVEAPVFNDNKIDGKEGADYWIEYWKSLHGNMNSFNGFMHNKMQFYTSDLLSFVQPMVEDKIPMFLRTSYDPEGHEVAHVSIQVQGVVFELFGPKTSLPSSSFLFTSLIEWQDSECPEAHQITTSLSVLSKMVSENNDADIESLELDGRPRLLLHTISMTNADPINDDAMTRYKQARHITGAESKLMHHDDTCTVVDMTWSNQNSLTVRYVNNNVANTGSKTLLDYDEYVALDHSTYVSGNVNSWDRYLDQHIGLWYDGSDVDKCNERAEVLRTELDSASLPYAERSEPDAHLFYVGYDGPMAFEYQFPGCDGGNSDATTESGCNAANSV